jgi:hypothetical protein
MAFHVEISMPMRHARVFNLNEGDLLSKVVGPWLENRVIEMGEREWLPEESSLKILDGPRMDPPDLSYGQGWSNAERKSEDVTRQVLADAPAPKFPDAFLVETDSPESVTADVVAGHGGRAITWNEAKVRLDGRDSEVAAVILVTRKPAAPGKQAPRTGS